MISGPELCYPPVVKATVAMRRISLLSRKRSRQAYAVYLFACFRGALKRGSRCCICLLLGLLGLRSQLTGASVVSFRVFR
jgi:hypothetical protein